MFITRAAPLPERGRWKTKNAFYGSGVSTFELRGTTNGGEGRQTNIFRETAKEKKDTVSLLSCGNQFCPLLAELTFGFMDFLQNLLTFR